MKTYSYLNHHGWNYPTAVPGQPLINRVEPNQGYIRLTWDKPSADGGTKITSYTAKVKSNSNATWASCKTTSELSCKISEVKIDAGYTVVVEAVNVIGKGSQSKGIFCLSVLGWSGVGWFLVLIVVV